MIDKIYIPTFGRIDNQISFNSLPEKWQKRSVLVIAESEKEALTELGYPTLVCPCQGRAPKGANTLDWGLPATRQWIHEQAGQTKYCVMDDDVQTFLYEASPEEVQNGMKPKAVINHPLNKKGKGQPEPGYEDYFDRMMIKISNHLDEVVTCGLDNVWTFPKPTSHQYNFRQTIIHFINGATFPDNIDWTSIKYAEDYYILLQLMTQGFQNIIEHRYRIGAGGTQNDGGCATSRTVERHNESMLQLKQKFPKYVRLKEKEVTSGPWKGNKKLAATISWKVAYADSQKRVNGLDDFF